MNYKIIPINQGWPIVGNVIGYIRRPFALLHANQRQYDEIVEIQLRRNSLYLLTTPELIEEVLVHQHALFRKDTFLCEYESVLGNGLLTSEGETWLQHHPVMQPAWYTQRIGEYTELMVRHTQEALRTIQNKTYVDVNQLMRDITLSVIGQMLFSTATPHQLTSISRALQEIMQHFGNNTWINILEQLSGVMFNKKRFIKYEEKIKQLDTTIDEIINERIAFVQQPNDLLGILINWRDETGQPLSCAQLRDECKTIVLAGHETTALNLSWTLWLVHANPAIAQRLRAEIDQVLMGRSPRYENVPSLVYTEKVIRESLRLKPPAWLTHFVALRDVDLNGYLIPAGKSVAISPLAIHHDPRWYPNPEQFNPDRWTDEFTQALPRYAYLPFSGGPRICIGQQFALLEATIILAMFIQRGNWQIDPKHTITTQASITMRPKNGIRMLVKYH